MKRYVNMGREIWYDMICTEFLYNIKKVIDFS